MARTILVPLDGSPLAEQGVHTACRVAIETDAEILLLTAVSFSARAGAAERTKERVALADARQYLAYQQQSIARYGIVAHALVVPGDAVRAILFTAENEDVDLISMATHGRSALRYALLGSVAAAVVRETRVPIMLSRVIDWPHAQEMAPYQRVLVPLDGTPFSEAALHFVKERELGQAGELMLLRAVDRARILAIPPKAPGDDEISMFDITEQETARRVREAGDYLHRLGVDHPEMPPYRIVVATDTPGRAIADTVVRDHADLVVLATHDRHGVDRLLHGSVARQVLQHTDVPVVLVRGETYPQSKEHSETPRPEEHVTLRDARAEHIMEEQRELDLVGSTRA
jgi:nucleotide-binding universal stress UspA family protein